MATDLDQPDLPEVDVFCPHCGARPIYMPEELVDVQHRLSASGYLHDDMAFRCSSDECGEQWTHGVPIGEYELDDVDDLQCHSCRNDPALDGDQYYRVHRVHIKRQSTAAQVGFVELHLKCPRCYLFAKAERDTDKRGVALVGFPDITGSIKAADHDYGYDQEVRLNDGTQHAR